MGLARAVPVEHRHLLLVGVYIRKNIRESKAFTQAKPEAQHEKIPLLVLIRDHPKALLQAIALRLPENGASYIFFTFSVVYARHIGISTGEIISAVTLAMLVEFFSILFWGALSDRIGLKPVYYIGVIGLLVMAFPFFWLLSTGTYGWIMLAMLLGLPFCHGAMIGTQPCIMSDLFPVRVRYSGLALGARSGIDIFRRSGTNAGGGVADGVQRLVARLPAASGLRATGVDCPAQPAR
ncbi:MFS transporter [Lelliottia nimipressuralis]|uniref:MFS transporter n=1 Tax=Lelliottia nimipressuralis TaxID=69220 RepID=UPI003D271A1C